MPTAKVSASEHRIWRSLGDGRLREKFREIQ